MNTENNPSSATRLFLQRSAKVLPPFLSKLLLCVLAVSLPMLLSARAAQKLWTGAAADTLWSTTANWSPAGLPGPSDNVTFTNLGAADAPLVLGGAVNTVVDGGFSSSINSLGFRNIEGSHNLDLPNLAMLTVAGASATDVAFIADDGQPAIMFVGSGQADGAADVVYTSIAGNFLVVSNLNANLSVMQGSVTSGSHWATLDLSGLNGFNCIVSNVLVAHDFGDPVMRPNGTLILAITNFIQANMISLSDAYQNAGSGGSGSLLNLGHANTVNVDRIRIGSHKCVGTLSFTAGDSGSAIFRNTAGNGREISWEIGDEFEPNTALGYYTSNQAIGVMDFTGGTVDALVDRITLGRGQTNAPTRTGDGNGTLTFGRGTIDANYLEMGVQVTGGASAGRGILNVNNDDGITPASMIIRSNLVMAVQLPGNTEATGSTAAVNINGGILSVAGDIIDGGGSSTINVNPGGVLDLKPAGDTTSGSIMVDVLNLNDGTLVNYATLSVSNISVGGSLTEFAVDATQTILPIAAGAIGTLAVTGDLRLRGTVDMDIKKVGSTKTADKIAVSGALDFGGTLKVRLSGSAVLALGDKFTLFTAASFANSFPSLILPPPGPGLTWTNKTAIDGTIQVIASPEPATPPTLAIRKSGTSVTISWPSAYTSFSLRGQTNAPGVGLTKTWGPVSGVSGNAITLPIDPLNGSAFFQLFQQ